MVRCVDISAIAFHTAYYTVSRMAVSSSSQSCICTVIPIIGNTDCRFEAEQLPPFQIVEYDHLRRERHTFSAKKNDSELP